MRRGQKASAEQVVLKLRRTEVQTAQGKSLSLACKEAELSEQSYDRWRKEYGGPQIDPARKMKDLERENARLRRLVADLSLVGQVLAVRRLGKLVAPERRRQAVDGIREKHGLSERHACRIVGQHRGTQRDVPTVPADEDALTRAIVALAPSTGATATAASQRCCRQRAGRRTRPKPCCRSVRRRPKACRHLVMA